MPPVNLTRKQRRFCEEYMVDMNATRAAKMAGYSEASAQVQGSVNLKKPAIQAYIDELLAEKAKHCHIDSRFIITELRKTMEDARVRNQHSVVVKCLENLARHCGFYAPEAYDITTGGEKFNSAEIQEADSSALDKALMMLRQRSDN